MFNPKEFLLLLLSSVLISSDKVQRRSRHNPPSGQEDHPEIVEAAVTTQPEGASRLPTSNKKLESSWTLWYKTQTNHIEKGRNLNKKDYLREVKKGGTFDSINAFWNSWNGIESRHSDCQFHLFKQGIKPVWEDPKNCKGGKCMLIAPKTSHGEVMKQWVSLMLTLLLGEFDCEVNGVVLAMRPFGNVFSVWIRNDTDKTAMENISKKLHELFGSLPIKFHRHQAAIKKYNQPFSNRPESPNNTTSSNTSSEEEQDRSYRIKRKSIVNDQTKEAIHKLMEEIAQPPIVVERKAEIMPAVFRIESSSPGISGNALNHRAKKIKRGDSKQKFTKPLSSENRELILFGILPAVNVVAVCLLLLVVAATSALSWMYL